MKKILYLLIGILYLSCGNNSNSSEKPSIAITEKLKSIEIIYSESREKTIEGLKKIWKCENLFIAKSETNFNGEISNDISIMITGIDIIDSEKKERNIKSTYNLIEKNILNYKEFSELEIIMSYTKTDGERITSNKTIKTTEL